MENPNTLRRPSPRPGPYDPYLSTSSPPLCQRKVRRPNLRLPPARTVLRRTPAAPKKPFTLVQNWGVDQLHFPTANGWPGSKHSGSLMMSSSSASQEAWTRNVWKFHEKAAISLRKIWDWTLMSLWKKSPS
jgi:hypothetical protein